MEISIVKIKNVVSDLLAWVRADLVTNVSTPTLSWLYQEFNGIVLDDTNFYTQLKHLVEQGDTDRRKLEVRLMFDKERANLPTIHIHYPNEDGRTGDNTVNTGFLGVDIISDRSVNKYSRSFIGQYELIITGGNSLEVVMLYEFMDALLIAGADTLSFNFDKFEFSGKQLMANQDIIPHLTFYRAIGLSLQSKKIVSSLISRSRPTDVQFHDTPYIDNQQPIDQLASVTITVSPTSRTHGSTLTFTPVVINGGTNPIYGWYLNGSVITGETSNTLSLLFSAAGTYTVQCKVYSEYQYMLPRPAESNILTIVIT